MELRECLALLQNLCDAQSVDAEMLNQFRSTADAINICVERSAKTIEKSLDDLRSVDSHLQHLIIQSISNLQQ